MKKIVPDPPQDLACRFELPAGMSLSTAILEGLIPIEEVLSNACHFLLFAYNDTVQSYEATQELPVKQALVESLRSLKWSWANSMHWSPHSSASPIPPSTRPACRSGLAPRSDGSADASSVVAHGPGGPGFAGQARSYR